MSPNKILATADDALLISRLGLTEEVDGRDPAGLRKANICIEGVSPEVVIEKENGSEEEECQQSEHISGVTPEEGHRVGLRC